MRNTSEALSVRDLLKQTYLLLNERHNPEKIVFSKKVLAEIANDSDYHRQRIGYMGYEFAGLFEINGKKWAIARGEACGGYPADPYDSDIMALKFELESSSDEEKMNNLTKAIKESEYFKNSLIYGTADGNINVSGRGSFGTKIVDLLRPKIKEFIVQKAEYDSQYISVSTLSPVCKKSIKYKHEFANFLADSIETVLK